MRTRILLILLFVLWISEIRAQTINLIPFPRELKAGLGHFTVTPGTKIISSPESHKTAIILQNNLKEMMGVEIGLAEPGIAGRGNIHFVLDGNYAKEQYTLDVSEEGIQITASNNTGWFYGVQSLLQLSPLLSDTQDSLPAVKIPEFSMRCGIRDQISCYSMLPWRNQFTYYDEALQSDTTIRANPGTDMYKELWIPFLAHFEKHLKAKRWFDRTVIAMDEREPEDMQKTIALVREVCPGFKIALAGNYHEEINDELYDLSAYITNDFPGEDLARRKAGGQRSTYYVCCIPEYPNTFTFSPPYQSTFIGWYAAAKGFDGFLRWAYNSWVKAPLIDSRYHHWSAGDTYPGLPGGKEFHSF